MKIFRIILRNFYPLQVHIRVISEFNNSNMDSYLITGILHRKSKHQNLICKMFDVPIGTSLRPIMLTNLEDVL